MIIKIDALLKENLRGKIIVFPTDTVYGIGCLFDDIEMIDRIYQLKARDYSKPMAVLAHDLDQLAPLVQMNDCFIKLARRHWPGALTLIGKKTEQVSYLATANLETVGVRIPDHQIALKILEHFGPMVTTSLNQTGEEAIYKLEDALMYLDKVDFLIPGGDLKQLASTVYDTLRLQVLRQGDVVI
jgi:L-threonylcarbamoyladenylate synthase